MKRRPPISTLFPYTTLSRSRPHEEVALDVLGLVRLDHDADQHAAGALEPRLVVLGEMLRDRLQGRVGGPARQLEDDVALDRKSTRLNSSHANISYAVFCLKK